MTFIKLSDQLWHQTEAPKNWEKTVCGKEGRCYLGEMSFAGDNTSFSERPGFPLCRECFLASNIGGMTGVIGGGYSSQCLPSDAQPSAPNQTPDSLKRSLKETALTAICDYLEACGWQLSSTITRDDGDFGYFFDPKTGQRHRSDFAWFVQTERDVYDFEKSLQNRAE